MDGRMDVRVARLVALYVSRKICNLVLKDVRRISWLSLSLENCHLDPGGIASIGRGGGVLYLGRLGAQAERRVRPLPVTPILPNHGLPYPFKRNISWLFPARCSQWSYNFLIVRLAAHDNPTNSAKLRKEERTIAKCGKRMLRTR